MMESFDERVGKKGAASRHALRTALTAARAGAWIVHQHVDVRALLC
ncbi:hypothetical protein PQQ53_11550 [Paraburkholderia strydomiana]|jgi:hypothetical protein|uniref:Uncharacterized protein n=1 Tax=Paraburkholderia strydomiana TaxID=1245417 RepID=A0ABW9EPM0_9BURK